jgi:beta-glucosidase
MRSVKRLRNFMCLVIGVAAVVGRTFASVAPTVATTTSPRQANKAKKSVPVYLNPAYPPAERAADLVSRMTTAEKAEEMDSSEAPGQATITATVRYHGATATGSVVVDVQ